MKLMIKNFLKRNFTSLAYFYRHLGYRIATMLTMSILVGLMDGLGLAMFLPMLEMVANDGGIATAEKMGNLAFVIDFIQLIGLSLNLTTVLLVMFGFFVLKGIFKFAEVYLNTVYRNYFIRNLREQTITALANYRYDAFVAADAGRIQNTLSGEVERVSAAYQNYMRMLQKGIIVMVYAALAFLSNPQFALLVAIGGIITNFLFKVIFTRTKQLSRQLTQVSHGFQGLVIQQVAFFKYLKSTGLIRIYASKLIDKVYQIELAQRKIGILNGVMSGVREPLLIAVVVFVILIQINWLGGSLGLIILSILFFYRALNSVILVQNAYNQYLERVGSLENLTAFSQELKVAEEKRGPQPFNRLNQKLELQNISFSYQTETPIITDISFCLNKEETLALVGESGSGKTTLLNIMSGLLPPTSGKVLLDGQDLREIDTAFFQKRIGYITQEPVIFDDTLFNNVTFWAPKTVDNLKRCRGALKKASLLEFVDAQSDLEDLRLGNNGINLSGGQKQRISIARELYKEVDFLFMDEATSALDSETERAIQENIDQLKGQYTMLIIAHRLSTIRNADRVVVLNQGRIEHIGTYQDLVDQSVSFKRMVELQEL